MTARDYILFILMNGLEDQDLIQDGKLIGFVTAAEAAEHLGLGIATIGALVKEGRMCGVQIGDTLCVVPLLNPIKNKHSGGKTICEDRVLKR